MKILFTIGSLAGGGAERVVARLSSKMAELGHELYVAMIANEKVEYEINECVNVLYIRPTIQIPGLRLFTRMTEYRKFVKRTAPDVVISFTAGVNVFALQALKGLSVNVIISERNNPYVDPVNEQDRKKRDILYRYADGLVFQTQDAMEYFSSDIQNKGVIILNPLDDSIPLPYVGERERRIVTVGRLEKQKNQRMLINAFAQIAKEYADYVLEIYGSGSLKEALTVQINELGLQSQVKLMGHDTDVLNHICGASAFVLPSDYEGISNALLEAMAMGMPVISTDHPIGGAKLLIENNRNGVLVPVGDEAQMASSIKKVLSDKRFMKSISDEAVFLRSRVSIDEIVRQWLYYIETVIDRNRDKK